MNLFKRVSVLLYVTLVLFLSCFLIMYAFHIPEINLGIFKIPAFNFDNVSQTLSGLLYGIYFDEDLKIFTLVFAVLMLISNLVFYRIYSVNVHRDKTIAFDNPSGRVSVSLMALEDMVKRLLAEEYEIREIKPHISAKSKKELNIQLRLKILSDVNIPTLTSRLQSLVKKKIHETIGMDGSVDVSIHISKILSEQSIKSKNKKETPKIEENPTETNIPFQGYRA